MKLLCSRADFLGSLFEGQGGTRCVCLETVRFKNGMNFFKGVEYGCDIKGESVSVSYEDGRFTVMGVDVFKKNFIVR